MSEPLNTQKAQRAQNGLVHLMKTKYASVGRSEYAVHRSWVFFFKLTVGQGKYQFSAMDIDY